MQRYADRYLNGDKNGYGDTVSMLLQHIDELGGPEGFAIFLRDHHKIGGKNAIPKENVCCQLAWYLKSLHIETIEYFQSFDAPELLEIVIRAVRGIGDAGVNYLFMLAGDQNRCKPDTHIHQCIKESCGENISNEECQILFSDTVHCLQAKYPNLTVCRLDGIIWRKYQDK